ncbi:MAG: hypothetical protein ACHQUC_06935 [Chlamydiales bacterium]
MVNSNKEPLLLGDTLPTPNTFPEIESVMTSFQDENFLALSWRKRFKKISQILCKLIQDSPNESFLLGPLLDFTLRINREKIAKEPYTLSSFEFWLNNFSDLSESENYHIRAKIAGKCVPRSDYQGFFPVGMDRVYAGSHFVVAHLSPDIDTMVASFWGWLDAFAVRLGTGLHQWALPDGPPDAPFTSIFQNLIGGNLFAHVARTTPSLTLTSMDLVTQRNVIKKPGNTESNALLSQEYRDKAIIIIDDQGNYLGEWRPSDVDLARQILIPFKSCLHWFEHNFQRQLISLFAKDKLSILDFPTFHASVFDIKLEDSAPALELNAQQKEYLNLFFHKVFGMEKGLKTTFRDFNQALEKLSLTKMAKFQDELKKFAAGTLFDDQGVFLENRPTLFNQLERIIHQLNQAVQEVRNFVERLDILLAIKHDILRVPQTYLTLRSDVEEMRNKMQHYDFLTVVIQDLDETLFPLGIIRSADLNRNGLGTVTFRDFCNLEEVKMASYLEVISVIDHHKNSLKTGSVPTALIGDVQSCNILLAEQAFLLNDKYSLGGMTAQQIEEQIKALPSPKTAQEIRILQRLLQRRIAAHHQTEYQINPKREYCEYFCFLQAILDDTDLLTKVSVRDLECIAQLLNRLKSLTLQKEVEILSFDDLPKDKNFVREAAKRILQQPDMYSIYKHVYSLREKSVETNLELCIKGQESNLFIDTKEQNGCARVGQTKLFTLNFPYYLKHAGKMRKIWLNKSKEVYAEHPEIDLHMHMISTIPSAEEVFNNRIGPYPHQDELWLWIPPTQTAQTHLNSFLASFQYSVCKTLNQTSLEFFGKEAIEFVQIFNQHFPHIHVTSSLGDMPNETVAVFRFDAGKLNSRKAMITPFLPRLLA